MSMVKILITKKLIKKKKRKKKQKKQQKKTKLKYYLPSSLYIFFTFFPNFLLKIFLYIKFP